MINISQAIKNRDRYLLKDSQESSGKKTKIPSSVTSLCINCSDYYEVPPCETNPNSDLGCFPSLTTD